MAFFPNLNAGSLTSRNSNNKKKDPAISVQDEHDCLCTAYSSLRNIHRGGGIKTTVVKMLFVNLGFTLLLVTTLVTINL
jgi:hypothetical protein